MEKLSELLGAELAPVAAVAFVFVGYVMVTIDRTRVTSPSRDDYQVGLKLVLFGLLLAGVQLLASGVSDFLGFALSGFKGGSTVAKMAMPPIIVGGLTVFGIQKGLLPRTNAGQFRQAERYFLGAVGAAYGAIAILQLDLMLTNVFVDGSWQRTAEHLAGVAVDGVIALYAVTRFGALVGWTMPVPPPPAPPPPPMMPPPQTPPPVGYGPPPTGPNPYAPR